MKVAICYSTKDRTDLSERTVEPLLTGARDNKYHLFWADGSDTEAGYQFAFKHGYPTATVMHNVRGGPDAAIVHNLTWLLDSPEQYTHIGLVENDVLLGPDWFERTMALFEQGDGLVVGAASARCYVDRILCQCDGYAVMHNLGAGMVVFTRRAARLALAHFRTHWTTANRSVFATLAGVDVGRYWAFRGGEHWLCADWGFDRVLAEHGLASLALTPSPIEMIGQDPPLAEQGLEIADREIMEFRQPDFLQLFTDNLTQIRAGDIQLPPSLIHADREGEIVFAHQLGAIGGAATGWRLKWFQGFGPFGYAADDGAVAEFPVSGPCHVMVRGGEQEPGRTRIEDMTSGFEMTSELQPGIMQAAFVPGGLVPRMVRVTGLTRGAVFHGVQCVHPQVRDGHFRFDHRVLPEV